MGLYVAHRVAHVVHRRGQKEFTRHVAHQSIADREPSDSGVRERREQWSDVMFPVATYPTAAMHQNGGRMRTWASGNVGIQQQPEIAHPSVLQVRPELRAAHNRK